MPIHYETSAQDRVILVTLSGAVKLQDYRDAARQLLGDAMPVTGFGLLVDARAIVPPPSVSELRSLVLVARELAAAGVAPFALVVADEIQSVAARLFAAFVGSVINLEARVFQDAAAARAWLRAMASRGGSMLGEAGPAADAPLSGDAGGPAGPPA